MTTNCKQIMTTSKNLAKESPRSPGNRLAGYARMARLINKGRASIEGNVGEYQYAGPLDQMLCEFKGVKADKVKKLLGEGWFCSCQKSSSRS
jgi:hypothetical protein